MRITLIIAMTFMFVAGITSLATALVTRLTDNDISYRIAVITMWLTIGMNIVVQVINLYNLLAA